MIGARTVLRFRHLTVVAHVLAGGCSNDPPPEPSPETNTQITVEGPKLWLGKRNDVTPEQWLLNHRTASGAAKAPAAEIRRTLASAARNFKDSPRMIANRAIQLEAMLAQHGIEENALDLLSDLSFTATPEKNAEGFGARCQHYYLLRIKYPSKQEALSALKRSDAEER